MQTLDQIESVGVIGAGQMGSGIAQVFAQSGFQTVLYDVSSEALDRAQSSISANLHRMVEKQRISAEVCCETRARLTTASELDHLGQCDLVIEAATENEALKTEIFRSLVPVIKPEAVLATNTSSISVTRLASVTDRPERFVGLHFMNPVPVMHLIEIIRGITTSPETFDLALQVAEAIGKQTTVSEDYPGFIVNRILIPMVNEAVYALMEGVGSVESIDSAMKLGANHPMGPLMLADFIGLDTCLSIMKVLNDGLHDPKYRPCPLLQKYVDANWLGRKTGRGFYDYSDHPPKPTR